MKVVTDKGEGDKCKKNSRDLIIFFLEKGQNPSFLYTPYVVVTEEGNVCLLEKLYRRTLDIPCSKR